MKSFWCGAALAFLLTASAVPAQADLQKSLEREYSASKANTMTVTEGNVDDLKKIMTDPKVNVICWQVGYDHYKDEYTPVILDWVRNGGSFWFYDARLAERYGMEMYEMRADQFKGKPEDGDIGEQSVHGVAVTVMPIKQHPVSTGVASVTVFMPMYEPERQVYGTIMPHEGTENLLQIAADSPAIVALRREGYGTVVYKSLLWEKSLSGERFQRNLIDFCAGYGVPGPAGEGRVGEMLIDKKNYVSGTAFVAPTSDAKEKAAPEVSGTAGSSGVTSLGSQNAGGFPAEMDAVAKPDSAASSASKYVVATPIAKDGVIPKDVARKVGLTDSAAPVAPSAAPAASAAAPVAPVAAPAASAAAPVAPVVAPAASAAAPVAPSAAPAASAAAPAEETVVPTATAVDSGSSQSAASAPQPSPSLDRFYTNDAPDVIYGHLRTGTLDFEGGSGSYHFVYGDLKRLERGQYGDLDKVELRDGTIIKGYLLTNKLDVDTDQGHCSYQKDKIKVIEFGNPEAK